MTNLPTRTATLTTYETEEDVRRALKAGAKGCLLKGTAPQRFGMPCGESPALLIIEFRKAPCGFDVAMRPCSSKTER
jgi:hypothetical protein